MIKKPHVHKNRFYNHHKESQHDFTLNGLQILLGRLKKVLMGRDTVFVPKGEDLSLWLTKPDFRVSPDEVKIMWLGHATCLIQIAGLTILTDPIFGSIGRFWKRYLPRVCIPEELPHIDVIIISHNHRDYVDVPSLKKLVPMRPLVLVPAGDERLMHGIGFRRIQEFQWGESILLETKDRHRSVELTFLRSVHWSGRGLTNINKSLWGSWLIQAANTKIYFAGDTAYGDHFKAIGDAFGPLDVVLMPIAPDAPRDLMAKTHVGVEEALQGFKDLRGKRFFPIHWGTFAFGSEQFDAPLEKLKKLWPYRDMGDVTLHVGLLGENIRVGE